ncbi:hypothetical protein V8V75_21145 [Peribacillus frigoritolerans]|uniref:hypothetical protein n=1 Tax=Peribacillus frigoritolerans TaxID=450367 RepID=UPI0030099C92
MTLRKLSIQLKIARQTVRKPLADAEIPNCTRQQERACPVIDLIRAFGIYRECACHAAPHIG